MLNGETVAQSTSPLLLFETALPTRYYLPRANVRPELLRTSDDLAWNYPAPIPECSKIEQAVCFHNEHVDLYVDGELQERPQTHWS